MLILFMILIFMFSAFQTFTGEHTKSLIQSITGVSEQQAYIMNAFVRKLAHVLIFGFLAILFHRGIRRPSIGYAWLCATLFAVLDEWHQSLVPGRTPSLKDVMLDSLAAFVFLLGFVWVKKKVKRGR